MRKVSKPMADFANYTPGEYAKEHIRITPTTLADGRDFFYLDDGWRS